MKKNFTKILALILLTVFVMNFALVSCKDGGNGGEFDQDVPNNNGDNGNGDDGEIKNTLDLVKDGKARFNIVYDQKSASNDLKRAVQKFYSMFKKQKIDVVIANPKFDFDVEDCEILIGKNIMWRDDYLIDTIPLGKKGYAIRGKDQKISICGGTDESTVKALELFEKKYLNIESTSNVPDLKNISVDANINFMEKEEYDVTSIKIAGENIGNFNIAYEEGFSEFELVAERLQDRVYSISGIWIPIVDLKDVGEKSIVIKKVPAPRTGGLDIKVKGTKMTIDCALPAVFPEYMEKFMGQHLGWIAEGDLGFEDNFKQRMNIVTISYCEYGGAVGNGVADDFDAMRKTHERANITGQRVVGDKGKKFNVGRHAQTIKIKSDVDLTDCEIIIDDRNVFPSDEEKVYRYDIFQVVSDYKSYEVTGIEKLSANQKNIGVTFKTDVLLYIKNDNERQYIRYGGNANKGNPMQEVILVDKDGNVDPSTPIMWDYKTVTYAEAYPCVDTPITIEGGTITTRANSAPKQYTYYLRGISVCRSNTVLKNITHLITDEKDTGAPYSGFFNVSKVNNVLFENCKVTGHKTYVENTRPDGSRGTSMGTYELGGNNSNNITWKNVTQTNDIMDKTLWGVMGTNYCKNLTYDGCRLSRFDAHCGVYNATIKDSEMGRVGINAIGGGTLLVENTILNTNTVVNLREDYGSTWNGDLIIKNITVNNNRDVTVVSGSWVNHYYGYVCHLPKNITIDGIKLAKPENIKVLPTFDDADISANEYQGVASKNPVVITEKIVIKNNKNDYKFFISNNHYLNKKVKMEEV